MRSDSQVRADFTAVAQGVVRFLLPKLIKKFVAALVAGKTERIGLCLLSVHGLTLFPRGIGSYNDADEQQFTSWKELNCIVADGQVAVFDNVAINQNADATARRLRAGNGLLKGKAVVMDFGYTNAILLDGIIQKLKAVTSQ